MKIFLLTFVLVFFTVIGNAEEKKALNEMTTEELMQEIMRIDNKNQKLDEKLKKEKRETESAKKVGRKLDELLGVLSKDK